MYQSNQLFEGLDNELFTKFSPELWRSLLPASLSEHFKEMKFFPRLSSEILDELADRKSFIRLQNSLKPLDFYKIRDVLSSGIVFCKIIAENTPKEIIYYAYSYSLNLMLLLWYEKLNDFFARMPKTSCANSIADDLNQPFVVSLRNAFAHQQMYWERNKFCYYSRYKEGTPHGQGKFYLEHLESEEVIFLYRLIEGINVTFCATVDIALNRRRH